MTTALVTIASGRHDHLARQVATVSSPVDHILVAMNDPSIADRHPQLNVVDIRSDGALPLAAARNAGARRAIERGADLIVFTDVDCLPTPGAIERFETGGSSLLTGAVGYLPDGSLESADATYHAFRPRPATGESVVGDPLLFWSLWFACTPATWERIGGFDERYTGYGAEDTDFGLRAQAAGVDVTWIGGAEALHQHHPAQSPPIQHLDDILRNGRLFAERWGFWPMRGWLDEFVALGLVISEPGGFYRKAVA